MISIWQSLSKSDCWVVSPVEAADLIHAKMRLGSGSVMSLAYKIARTIEKPNELGARIIDRAVSIASEQMKDWKFRDKIAYYKEQAMSRVNFNQDAFDLDVFDKETDKFFEQQGVENVRESTNSDY